MKFYRAFTTEISFFSLGRCQAALFASTLAFLGISQVTANPTGGNVTSGSATIQNSPGSTLIRQSSNAAIINWQTFSINHGESTQFLQPSSQAATLNRVLGGGTSHINGTLSANGQLYLINQNGVLVGPGGIVNAAGGFTASTRGISDSDFLKGNLHFVGHGKAGIQNAGVISSSLGNVILIGKTVTNRRMTNTGKGTVGLVAGDNVLLGQQNTDGSTITVSPSPLAKNSSKKTGITNLGTISGAATELKAANGNIYSLAINNGGTIRSTTVAHQGGHIWLESGSGAITNTGHLNASATVFGGSGGSITLKGKIVADSGTIVANGGTNGAGGNVDISGSKLKFTGTVDLTSPNGTTGDLLLDPATLQVVNGGTGTIVSGENNSATTISPTTVDAALGTANIILNADNSITISNGLTWSSTSTLTLSTNTSGSTIAINAPISAVHGGLTINTAAANDVITPSSAGSINIGTFILQSGDWNQNANGGTLASFAAATDFELQGSSTFLRVAGGNDTQATPYLITDIYGLQGIGSPSNSLSGNFVTSTYHYYAQTQNINATGTATWNSGAGFSPIGNVSYPFMGIYNGNNHTISNLTINLPNNRYIGLFGGAFNSTFENVGLVGGSVTGGSYVGGLLGSGDIYHPSTTTITNCYTTGSVFAEWEAGDLAGNGVVINNSYSSGTVTGTNSSPDFLGGLAGAADVSNSYSIASIYCQYGGLDSGGLIGAGSATNSYFAGSINVGNNSFYIGGLIGQSSGTTSNCYVTGTISLGVNSAECAGLVGFNVGNINNCYSVVIFNGSGSAGLVGLNEEGTVNNCYYIQDSLNNINVNLPAIGEINPGAVVNGATPVTLAQLKTQSTFQPQGSGNWDFTLGSGVWGINGYSSTGLINNGLPYLQSQYPTQALLTPSSQQLVYSKTTGGLNQSAYTVTFNPNNTGSQNVLSNLLSSEPTLTVVGNNVNVVNPGAANTVNLAVLPKAGVVVEVSTSPATVTYTPATLYYYSNFYTKTYGENNPSFSGTVFGFVGNDSQASATTGNLMFYSNASTNSNAGSYGVYGYGLTPNSNYVMAQLFINSQNFQISPRPVYISGNNLSSVPYGTTPPFSYSVSGLINGDSLGGTVIYSNPNYEDLTTAAGLLNPGVYAYQPTVTNINSNYGIVFDPGSFGTFVIGPRLFNPADHRPRFDQYHDLAFDYAFDYAFLNAHANARAVASYYWFVGQHTAAQENAHNRAYDFAYIYNFEAAKTNAHNTAKYKYFTGQ